MMNWLAKRRRRKTLLKGLRIVGPLLKERYGASDTYTVGQVRRSVEDARVPKDFITYGYAIFLQKDDFDTVQQKLGREALYYVLRREVADLCFSGEINFSVKRALSFGGSSMSHKFGTNVDEFTGRGSD